MTALTQARPSLDVRVTGRRVMATWIDLVLVGLAYRLLATLLHLPPNLAGRLNGTGAATEGDFASRVVDNLPGLMAYFVLAGVYYVVLESVWGRTVGKLATGIRVVTDTGERAGFGRILARTALRLLDGFGGYLVGFLVVVSSSRRQRLGDITAGTMVVRA
jgi:uncharacterized RDD family membrane protein YckC